MVNDYWRVCEASRSVQFTVVVVQLAVWATHNLLVLSAAPLAHALRHIVDYVTLSALAAVLHKAGVCKTTETTVSTTVICTMKRIKTQRVVSSLQCYVSLRTHFTWETLSLGTVTLANPPPPHANVQGWLQCRMLLGNTQLLDNFLIWLLSFGYVRKCKYVRK